jgi:glycosyltransferase involved in cell wall biosynthesis
VIVHQWVPAAHAGDAVGGHALAIRALLRARGHESELFALQIDPALVDDARPFTDANARDGDVTILHFASASPMSDAFARLPGTRVLDYHNVTPAAFFADFDPDLAALASAARRELAALAGKVDLALGDSEFSRAELEALGFASTGVLPVAVDATRLRDAPARPALERLLQDGLANILFVGRIAPNKKIEDHLRLAEHYKRYVDADARFIFAGRTDACPGYYRSVQAMLDEYRMLPERFVFTGGIPDADLAAYYRHAHAYVSLSEHEGFGVPLVEAMAMDVPVVAYGATAIPETLGGAGLSFAPKDLELAAELLGTAVYDERVRHDVITGQRRRLDAFAPAAFERRLLEVLEL